MTIAKAYLVESIPLGMEELRQTDGVGYTEFVLKRLVDSAQETIDLAAMYWNLLPDVDSVDEEGFSEEQLAALGVGYGRFLHGSLANAARRGVRIRILQSSGFKEGAQESDELAQQYPDQVHVRQLHLPHWYGGGIMHQKSWVFDRQHMYIGSANTDWKSIAQVKELGVVVEHHPEIATDAMKQFDVWWRLCEMEPATAELFDPAAQVMRTVPVWSELVVGNGRSASPFDQPDLYTPYNIANPMAVNLNGEDGDVFITGCPPEMCAPGRTYDLDGILHTMRTARKSICISMMDFLPTSLHRGKYDEESGKRLINGEVAAPVWWPTLIDALLQAVITRQVDVRLLVSHWAYSPPITAPYLRALRETAVACQSDATTRCGQLEIKQFIIPGWDDNTGPDRQYPGHSRVNHTKFIITDRRLNIGTSNLTWDYFANSAGASFNSNHPDLVQKLQEIFDRDWASPYAHPLGD